MQAARILHPIVQRRALECLRSIDADAAGLEGADTRGDHHGTRIERRTRGGLNAEAPAFLTLESHHFLAEMECRVKRLDLLHEPVDELLRAAHRQRRNIV